MRRNWNFAKRNDVKWTCRMTGITEFDTKADSMSMSLTRQKRKIMAQGDSYVPMGERNGPFPQVLPSTVAPTGQLSGHGSPEGVVPGIPGTLYKNLDTLDQWLKMAGSQETGWRLVGKFST